MSIYRIRSWRSALVAWAESLRGQSFEWGRTDCASLVRHAFTICFGQDVVPEIPRWTTATAAARVLAEYPIEDVLRELEAEVLPLSFARGGDIIVLPEPEEEVGRVLLMVCIDASSFLSVSRDDGVQIVGLEQITDPGACRVYSLWEVRGADG